MRSRRSRRSPLCAATTIRATGQPSLPTHASLTVQQVTILVVHDIADVGADPRGEGIGVVVTGHSHKPLISERDGVLFVNPGSAGPRRFKLPVSAGILMVEGARAKARFESLLT